MNFFRHFPVILIGCALVACGGGKSTPAVNPSVNAPGAKVSPKAPELTPAPEPPPSQEQKMYMDNAVDRYSYARALGTLRFLELRRVLPRVLQ